MHRCAGQLKILHSPTVEYAYYEVQYRTGGRLARCECSSDENLPYILPSMYFHTTVDVLVARHHRKSSDGFRAYEATTSSSILHVATHLPRQTQFSQDGAARTLLRAPPQIPLHAALGRRFTVRRQQR
jgi:hypothetical protein